MLAKMINLLHKSLFIELNSSAESSVFVAGCARSGTTWLSQIINFQNRYRYIFEPFHPHRCNQFQHYPENYYLHPSQDNNYTHQVTRILRGKIRSASWADKFNHKLIVERRLIKSIRANLFLYWIRANYPSIPIVFILRHPCAVANSKLKLPKSWRLNPKISQLVKQEKLSKVWLNQWSEIINQCSSEFEQQILQWCILNYIPLKQFTAKDLCLVFYENLILNPEKELGKISKYLNLNLASISTQTLKKPSATTNKKNPYKKTAVFQWRQELTHSQQERAKDIMSSFGMDQLYNQALPLEKKFYRFMAI